MLGYTLVWQSINVLLRTHHIPADNIFLTPFGVMNSKYLSQKRFITSVWLEFVCGMGYIFFNIVVKIECFYCPSDTIQKH